MARVTGPLHSDTASGSFAKALVFSHWKGDRKYVRERIIPMNPKAAKQVGVRALMGYCAHLWNSIKAASSASWQDLANAAAISTFNAYIQAALNDWQNGLFPRRLSTDARTSTALTITTQTATGGIGTATIQLTPSGATAIAGFAIYRAATGFTAGWDNCIAILAADGANPVTWIDSPLAAGTYYYRSVAFNTDGKMGTLHAESSGVVVTAP